MSFSAAFAVEQISDNLARQLRLRAVIAEECGVGGCDPSDAEPELRVARHPAGSVSGR
jgi:hypothetical protein